MSRTYKDRPYRLLKKSMPRVWYPNTYGSYPKLKRSQCDKHCMPTPSWWWHMTTTKIRRAEFTREVYKFRLCNKNAKIDIDSLEDLDYTRLLIWNKPQEYYW